MTGVVAVSLFVGSFFTSLIFPITATDTQSTPPDFGISINPTSISVLQDNSTTATVSITFVGGYENKVTLSSSGAPSGVSIEFSPSNGSSSFNSTMTIFADSDVSLGSYPITITGSGADSTTHSTSYTLTVTRAREGLKLTPVADTYIDRDNPFTNYGTAKTIAWQYTGGSPPDRYRSYLKFDISSILLPDRITSSTLYLYNTTESSGNWTGDSFDILSVTDDNWIETRVTWNSSPSFTERIVDRPGGRIPAGWIASDVTSYVQSQYNDGETIVSFGIQVNGWDGKFTQANSSEAIENRPFLEIVGGETVELVSGWNLFSLPLRPENSEAGNIFSEFGEFPTIYRWSDGYEIVEKDDNLMVGEGYWVYSKGLENLKITGTPISSMGLQLEEGWNLIGVPDDVTPVTPREAFGTPAPTIYKWADGYGLVENDMDIVSGQGYWIYMPSSEYFLIG